VKLKDTFRSFRNILSGTLQPAAELCLTLPQALTVPEHGFSVHSHTGNVRGFTTLVQHGPLDKVRIPMRALQDLQGEENFLHYQPKAV